MLRMTRRVALVCAAVAVCATPWWSSTLAAPKSTARVRIVTTMRTERVLTEAQRIADLACDVADELVFERKSRGPYAVTLFETLSEYQGKDNELTGGKFASNWAFSSHSTKESYIALMPPMSEALRAEIGLTFLMQSQIAHEVGHQVSYHAIPAYVELPLWLSEGLACWVELETMRRAKLLTAIEHAPFYSRRLVLVREMLRDKTWPGAQRIFQDDYGTLDTARRYAIWSIFGSWLFDDVLKDRRRALFAQTRKLAATSPDVKSKLTAVFTKALGSRMDDLDAEFAAYVAAHEPQWDETLRAVERRGDDWFSVSFATADATSIAVAPVGSREYTVRGSIEFLPTEIGDLRLHVARSNSHELEVHFVRDQGVILHWHDFGGGGAPGPMGTLEGNGPFAFEIRVTSDRATAWIDGKEVSSLEIETPADGGRVGLGAAASSAGIWREFRVDR